jgi:hypothetical protein
VVDSWHVDGRRGGGETPSWPKGRRFALHQALVAGNLAYAVWRDGGLTVLDVGDPTQPKLLAHRNLDPPFGGGTHSPLPLPDRNLLVLAERPTYDLTIFKLHCGKLTLKIYTKGERVLRIEAVAHNTRELNCGRSLEKFPEVVSRLN